MPLSNRQLEAHVLRIIEARRVSVYSKDPSTQVGAAIFIDLQDYEPPIAVGYNKFPQGLLETDERLNDRPTKYMYTVHAETAALFDLLRTAQHNRIPSLSNLVMYVYGVCVCTDCMKDIAQAGIKKVYYYRNDSVDSNTRWSLLESTQAIVNECGITFVNLNFEQITKEIQRRDAIGSDALSA